jgi:Zn-dependent protease
LLLARSPFLFGYAKPVPVNFGALRNPRIGMVLVAAAGPAMNKQALGEGSGASCSPKVRQSFRFTLPTAREKKLLSFRLHHVGFLAAATILKEAAW